MMRALTACVFGVLVAGACQREDAGTAAVHRHVAEIRGMQFQIP
jgi:hypothetical protein